MKCRCMLCLKNAGRPVVDDDPRVQKVFDQMMEQVEERGFTTMGIMPRKGSEGPAWAYTIGFWHSYKHPELVIADFDVRIAHLAFLGAAKRLARGEKIVGLVEGLIEGGPPFKTKPMSWTETTMGALGSGLAFYQVRKDPAALFLARQLLWQDKEGRFPGDAGTPAGWQELTGKAS